MTQERLRELLRERVADEAMPDYSVRAWQAARVVRRRRRLGAAAGVVAATVGISGAIAALESTSPHPRPTPVEPVTQSPPPDGAPNATYQGVPVWWSPDQHEEQELPPVDSPLPAEIDLSASEPHQPGELDRAVAAFARGRSVILVGTGGELRTVDVSRLEKVTKPNGYAYFPTSTGMLSPTGAYLAFLQAGHVAVYTVATATWNDVDTSGGATDTSGGGGLQLTWVADDQFVITGPMGGLDVRRDVTGRTLSGVRVGPLEPAFDHLSAQPYGRAVRSPRQDDAQSWGMGVPLPVRRPGTDLSDPEFIVARGAVLAMMWAATDGLDSRFKDCCPVAGWLDDDTVVYESRQTDPLLVSWRVGSREFGLVSRITGAYDVASFAL